MAELNQPRSKEALDENRKLEFSIAAMDEPDPFAVTRDTPEDIRGCYRWLADRSVLKTINDREAIMCELERQGELLRHACVHFYIRRWPVLCIALPGDVARVEGGWPTPTLK